VRRRKQKAACDDGKRKYKDGKVCVCVCERKTMIQSVRAHLLACARDSRRGCGREKEKPSDTALLTAGHVRFVYVCLPNLSTTLTYSWASLYCDILYLCRVRVYICVNASEISKDSLTIPPPARTHARTHACTHTRTHARTHAFTRARMHAHTHAHTHVRTHAGTHVKCKICTRCSMIRRSASS